MVRLVFIDMDDTFVGPDKTIPRDNLRILDVAAERGVQFVPCTGRSLRGVPRELVTHPSVSHAVCGGGALVYDVRSGRVVREVPIDRPLVRALHADVRGRRATRDAVAARPGLFGASSIPMNLEVTSAEAAKGTALLWLCERLGVDVADTVAFGDSENDVSMLDVAGDAVAMENAPRGQGARPSRGAALRACRSRALPRAAARLSPAVPGARASPRAGATRAP